MDIDKKKSPSLKFICKPIKIGSRGRPTVLGKRGDLHFFITPVRIVPWIQSWDNMRSIRVICVSYKKKIASYPTAALHVWTYCLYNSQIIQNLYINGRIYSSLMLYGYIAEKFHLNLFYSFAWKWIKPPSSKYFTFIIL